MCQKNTHDRDFCRRQGPRRQRVDYQRQSPGTSSRAPAHRQSHTVIHSAFGLVRLASFPHESGKHTRSGLLPQARTMPAPSGLPSAQPSSMEPGTSTQARLTCYVRRRVEYCRRDMSGLAPRTRHQINMVDAGCTAHCVSVTYCCWGTIGRQGG